MTLKAHGPTSPENTTDLVPICIIIKKLDILFKIQVPIKKLVYTPLVFQYPSVGMMSCRCCHRIHDNRLPEIKTLKFCLVATTAD